MLLAVVVPLVVVVVVTFAAVEAGLPVVASPASLTPPFVFSAVVLMLPGDFPHPAAVSAVVAIVS